MPDCSQGFLYNDEIVNADRQPPHPDHFGLNNRIRIHIIQDLNDMMNGRHQAPDFNGRVNENIPGLNGRHPRREGLMRHHEPDLDVAEEAMHGLILHGNRALNAQPRGFEGLRAGRNGLRRGLLAPVMPGLHRQHAEVNEHLPGLYEFMPGFNHRFFDPVRNFDEDFAMIRHDVERIPNREEPQDDVPRLVPGDIPAVAGGLADSLILVPVAGAINIVEDWDRRNAPDRRPRATFTTSGLLITHGPPITEGLPAARSTSSSGILTTRTNNWESPRTTFIASGLITTTTIGSTRPSSGPSVTTTSSGQPTARSSLFTNSLSAAPSTVTSSTVATSATPRCTQTSRSMNERPRGPTIANNLAARQILATARSTQMSSVTRPVTYNGLAADLNTLNFHRPSGGRSRPRMRATVNLRGPDTGRGRSSARDPLNIRGPDSDPSRFCAREPLNIRSPDSGRGASSARGSDSGRGPTGARGLDSGRGRHRSRGPPAARGARGHFAARGVRGYSSARGARGHSAARGARGHSVRSHPAGGPRFSVAGPGGTANYRCNTERHHLCVGCNAAERRIHQLQQRIRQYNRELRERVRRVNSDENPDLVLMTVAEMTGQDLRFRRGNRSGSSSASASSTGSGSSTASTSSTASASSSATDQDEQAPAAEGMDIDAQAEEDLGDLINLVLNRFRDDLPGEERPQ